MPMLMTVMQDDNCTAQLHILSQPLGQISQKIMLNNNNMEMGLLVINLKKWYVCSEWIAYYWVWVMAHQYAEEPQIHLSKSLHHW